VREIAGAQEAGRRVATVYFGGGTPSLLAPGALGEVLDALGRVFAIDADAEVTIEVNPGTVDRGSAAALRRLGFNRASLGVQSLDDATLARIGRTHSAAQAREAFAALRAAGFGNVGVDLIHGLPGQTPAAWRSGLREAVALGPEHLSLYALGLEAGTPLAEAAAHGALALPGEEEEMEMLRIAAAEAAAGGYERYEISNWARPGFRSRHNLACWRLAEYRGFGAAAHSFLRRPEPVRLANLDDPAAYAEAVAAGRPPLAAAEEPDPQRLAGEALMLALRTTEGADEAAFAAAHGGAPAELFPGAVAHGLRRGWLERAAGRLRLTGSGLLFSNAVFRDLF